MNRMDDRANVTSIAFPIATIPIRRNVDVSKAFSTAPQPNPRNADQGSRTVVHSPLGSSNDAR